MTVGLVASVAWLLYRDREQLAQVEQVSLVPTAGMLAMYALHILIVGNLLQLFLRRRGVAMKLREWFPLSLASALYNRTLPLKGGALARGFYLKTTHDLPLVQYGGLLIQQTVLKLMVGCFIGVLIFVAAPGFDTRERLRFSLAATAGLIGSAGLLASPNLATSIARKLGREIHLRSWTMSRALWTSSSLSVLLLVSVLGARLYLGFHALGLSARPWDCLGVAALLFVVQQFSVTPDNWGVRELVLAFTMRSFGYTTAEVLLVSLFDRAVGYAFLIPTGVLSNWYLVRGLGQKAALPPENET